MSEQSRNQRRYFRLWYPVIDRPSLRIGDQEYLVCELSEGGLRFVKQANADLFPLGAAVLGAIKFHDGQVVSVAGVNGQLHHSTNVIVQLQGIEYARMILEQLHLRRKYPDLRSFERPIDQL